MARRGKDSWEKYYKGNDGIVVEVKKVAPYYEDNTTVKSSGNLILNTKVIYQDSFSQHIKTGGSAKIAFQFNRSGPIYYSSIDNFIKPGGVSGVGLRPKNFGIENETFDSSISYYTTLVNALDVRLASKEIGAELYEYLLAVLNYVKNGSANFSDIQKDSLPWGEIVSYFGELAGPLACVSGRCANISSLISSVSSCKIYMPYDSNSLYDYKLISNDAKEYMISAKAGKSVSNVIKPQFVVEPLNQIVNDSQLTILKQSLAYKVLQVLADNEVKSGAFYAYQLINPNLLTGNMINSILSIYKTNRDSSKEISDPELLMPFINKIKNYYSVMSGKKPEDMTVGLLRYVCEQEIAKWSKTSIQNANLKQIFQKYLHNTRVIYVKMTASATQNPSFSAFGGEMNSVKKVNSIELRTKNGIERADDKVGFQVI